MTSGREVFCLRNGKTWEQAGDGGGGGGPGEKKGVLPVSSQRSSGASPSFKILETWGIQSKEMV